MSLWYLSLSAVALSTAFCLSLTAAIAFSLASLRVSSVFLASSSFSLMFSSLTFKPSEEKFLANASLSPAKVFSSLPSLLLELSSSLSLVLNAVLALTDASSTFRFSVSAFSNASFAGLRRSFCSCSEMSDVIFS